MNGYRKRRLTVFLFSKRVKYELIKGQTPGSYRLWIYQTRDYNEKVQRYLHACFYPWEKVNKRAQHRNKTTHLITE